MSETAEKPELKAGQMWVTRGGDVVEVREDYTEKFVVINQSGQTWTTTKHGEFHSPVINHPCDLVKFIPDASEGGGV